MQGIQCIRIAQNFRMGFNPITFPRNSIIVSNQTSRLFNHRLFANEADQKTAATYAKTRSMCKSIGLVGLPNVGKSTIFNALTSTQLAEASNYPFCTIKPNVARVSVPDPRLDVLAKMNNSAKIARSQIEFVDIAGLIKGASKGEGLGNQFLANIREVSVILHVVRCYEDDSIVHVENSIDPIRDIETIELELMLSDLEALERSKKKPPKNELNPVFRAKIIERTIAALEQGTPAAQVLLSEDEWPIFKQLNLLSSKPMMYLCNVSDSDVLGNKYTDIVKERAKIMGTNSLIISARLEEELANTAMKEEEKLELAGIKETGISQVIRESREYLGFQCYYTAGEKESASWQIPPNTKARDAAGVIHSDFAKGFIRAEVISYADYIKYGGEKEAKTNGKLRSEGPNYIVHDGDVMLFRFNV